MRNNIPPGRFGFHRSTVIEQTGLRTFTLVVRRKSRLIMADGKKLLEKADVIRALEQDAVVRVETTAPVCSKTEKYLTDHSIEVFHIAD